MSWHYRKSIIQENAKALESHNQPTKVAKDYWKFRSELDKEQDKKFEVTFQDYYLWVKEVLDKKKKQETLQSFIENDKPTKDELKKALSILGHSMIYSKKEYYMQHIQSGQVFLVVGIENIAKQAKEFAKGWLLKNC